MTIVQGDYLELRELPESDLPNLWKVYQGTPLYFDGIGYDFKRLRLEDVRAQWLAAQGRADRVLFGIYHTVTGLLVGAIEVRVGEPEPHVGAAWLLIWGGFQRQGYGQECLALAEAWLLQQHGVALRYAIAGDNQEGLSFLHLQGFTPTGQPAPSPVASGRAFWMRRAD